MISRYSRPEMAKLWKPEYRFSLWLRIEILACEAYHRMGKIPAESLKRIQEDSSFSVERIDELECILHHDVIAFLTAVGERIGEDARFMHVGMTSSDVLDTALACQLTEAADLVLLGIDGLMEEVKQKAFDHKNTIMIGRSHGIHAEPITFGLKMALWYEELKRNRTRVRHAREVISVGKISGAVGTYAAIPPEVEGYVCERLGLRPAPVSTQIIQRDRHAEYFSTLSILGSSLEKFALEIRHLQRTEIREAEEHFSKGQKGSSAMPHKRNPILSENLTGLARLMRSYALAAMENVALWHERDISHSSVERVIGPDATILIDFMLHRMTHLMRRLHVYPDRMKKNLALTKGLVFSQELLLRLVKKGMPRDDAYRLVQGCAMEVWESEEDLQSRISRDPGFQQLFSPSEIQEVFQYDRFVRHSDEIFDRVFGSSARQDDQGNAGPARE
jgi:adenylosuccinate lyase